MISKRNLIQTFLRSLSIEASYNHETMMTPGFIYSIYPALKSIYGSLDEQKRAVQRESTVFNSTSAVAPFIIGTAISMEEKMADGRIVGNVSDMKSMLMGPLSALGDDIFWGSLRIATLIVGIDLTWQGHLWGPLVFILLYNIPNYLVRYYGLKLGYQNGLELIQTISKTNILRNVTNQLNVIAMILIGAIASKVRIPQWNFASSLSSVLVLLLVVFFAFLMKKKVRPIAIILLLAGIAVIGAFYGN